MRSLFLALHTEGETDDRFLSNVVLRTVDQLVRKHAEEEVEVYPLLLAKAEGVSGSAEKIREAARIARNCHILIVHRDADKPKPANALSDRYEPGKQLVGDVPATERICRTLVPIIPVRMMEAWLLADIATIMAEVETNISEQQLKAELKIRGITFPTKPKQLSSIIDPKDVLEQIVRITNRRKTRQELYEPVGRKIKLDRLNKVPEYEQFIIGITQALTEIHVLPSQDKRP